MAFTRMGEPKSGIGLKLNGNLSNTHFILGLQRVALSSLCMYLFNPFPMSRMQHKVNF